MSSSGTSRSAPCGVVWKNACRFSRQAGTRLCLGQQIDQVKPGVSQCSKTTAGSEAFAIFKSLTQTARLRGLDPFQILLDHRREQNTR